jgi:phosphatidylserine decarboxylase
MWSSSSAQAAKSGSLPRMHSYSLTTTARVDKLFAKNERLITHLETEAFDCVEVVKVGATRVPIAAAYDPTSSPTWESTSSA